MPDLPPDCTLPRASHPVPEPPPSALSTTAPPKLRRTWFGLAPDAVHRLLAGQGREWQAHVQAAQAAIQVEIARQDEHAGEIRRTRARLDALQADLQMLRATLAQEQAREKVIAEVATRQLAAMRQAHERRMQDLRFEAIRLEAELGRREAEVTGIAAELYRIASTNGKVPAGLAVHMPALQGEAPTPALGSPAPAAEPRPEPTAPLAPSDRNRMLVGKRLWRPLVAPDGRLIGASGDAISDAMIAAAEEHGLVAAMIGGIALPDET